MGPWHNPPVAGTLLLGTSGYDYTEWRGVFYPQDLPPREMLPYFASRFRTVEINYTFRKQPSDRTLATWRRRTPPGFVLTLKAHHGITHRHRLRDAREPVESFVLRARLLGDRLGPILFQCPPNLAFDRELAEAFLDVLPPGGRYAMELRHPSWEDARGLLAERGVAWCTAETDEQPAGQGAWAPFGYLRLRKETYPNRELRGWAERIRAALDSGHDVYCYFKHEAKGAGPVYADRLAALLAAGS